MTVVVVSGIYTFPHISMTLWDAFNDGVYYNKSSTQKMEGGGDICKHQHQWLGHSVVDFSVHSLLVMPERNHQDRQADHWHLIPGEKHYQAQTQFSHTLWKQHIVPLGSKGMLLYWGVITRNTSVFWKRGNWQSDNHTRFTQWLNLCLSFFSYATIAVTCHVNNFVQHYESRKGNVHFIPIFLQSYAT